MKQITKDTLLKQGDKSYPAIQIEQGIVWIDKDAEIKQGDWYIDFSLDKPSLYQMKYKQWGEEGHLKCKKIIAANIDLEGVPNIEMEDDNVTFEALDRAYKYLYALGYFTMPTNEGRIVENLLIQARIRNNKETVNQAKYTEEDIYNIIIARDKEHYTNAIDMKHPSEYLQSINSIKEITVDENFKQI